MIDSIETRDWNLRLRSLVVAVACLCVLLMLVAGCRTRPTAQPASPPQQPPQHERDDERDWRDLDDGLYDASRPVDENRETTSDDGGDTSPDAGGQVPDTLDPVERDPDAHVDVDPVEVDPYAPLWPTLSLDEEFALEMRVEALKEDYEWPRGLYWINLRDPEPPMQGDDLLVDVWRLVSRAIFDQAELMDYQSAIERLEFALDSLPRNHPDIKLVAFNLGAAWQQLIGEAANDEANANGEEADANGEEADANGEEADANGEEADANGEEADANGEEADANGEETAYLGDVARGRAIRAYQRVLAVQADDSDVEWINEPFRHYASVVLAQLMIERGDRRRAIYYAYAAAFQYPRRDPITGQQVPRSEATDVLLPALYDYADLDIREESDEALVVLLTTMRPELRGRSPGDLLASVLADAMRHLVTRAEQDTVSEEQWPQLYTHQAVRRFYERWLRTYPDHERRREIVDLGRTTLLAHDD